MSTEPQPLQCVEITLEPPDETREALLEAALWEAGIEGLERHDDETWSALVEDPRPWQPGTVRWRVFRSDTALQPFADAVRDATTPVAQVAIDAWTVDDLSFLEKWKDHFRPTRVSPRIIVHPPWDRPAIGPEEIGVEIEPGMAFGTGTHETTRLCLAALDDTLRHPLGTVLDVGTGSGILAIAAARLGAVSVTGVDNDPLARRIARENAALNDVAERCAFPDDGIETLSGVWDIVLANILPHVLIDLRDPLIARVRSGGSLILSGILVSEVQRVQEAFAGPLGAEGVQKTLNEWCALVFGPIGKDA